MLLLLLLLMGVVMMVYMMLLSLIGCRVVLMIHRDLLLTVRMIVICVVFHVRCQFGDAHVVFGGSGPRHRVISAGLVGLHGGQEILHARGGG